MNWLQGTKGLTQRSKDLWVYHNGHQVLVKSKSQTLDKLITKTRTMDTETPRPRFRGISPRPRSDPTPCPPSCPRDRLNLGVHTRVLTREICDFGSVCKKVVDFRWSVPVKRTEFHDTMKKERLVDTPIRVSSLNVHVSLTYKTRLFVF